jgi:hypothetical protein
MRYAIRHEQPRVQHGVFVPCCQRNSWGWEARGDVEHTSVGVVPFGIAKGSSEVQHDLSTRTAERARREAQQTYFTKMRMIVHPIIMVACRAILKVS